MVREESRLHVIRMRPSIPQKWRLLCSTSRPRCHHQRPRPVHLWSCFCQGRQNHAPCQVIWWMSRRLWCGQRRNYLDKDGYGTRTWTRKWWDRLLNGSNLETCLSNVTRPAVRMRVTKVFENLANPSRYDSASSSHPIDSEKETNIMITPCICKSNLYTVKKRPSTGFWVCTPMIRITSILQISWWPSRQILFRNDSTVEDSRSLLFR